jgi:hypothetical protein
VIFPAWIAAAPCVLGAFSDPAPQTVQEVVEAVRMGDFRRAQLLTERESDPLLHAQADCYLRHHAGDLDGAYAAARRGLAHVSGDPWLLDRATYIALTLRDAAAAQAHLSSLEETLRTSELGPTGDRQGSDATVSAHRSDLAELSLLLAERDCAGMRARSVSSALLALIFGALACFARTKRAGPGRADERPWNATARR